MNDHCCLGKYDGYCSPGAKIFLESPAGSRGSILPPLEQYPVHIFIRSRLNSLIASRSWRLQRTGSENWTAIHAVNLWTSQVADLSLWMPVHGPDWVLMSWEHEVLAVFTWPRSEGRSRDALQLDWNVYCVKQRTSTAPVSSLIDCQ